MGFSLTETTGYLTLMSHKWYVQIHKFGHKKIYCKCCRKISWFWLVWIHRMSLLVSNQERWRRKRRTFSAIRRIQERRRVESTRRIHRSDHLASSPFSKCHGCYFIYSLYIDTSYVLSHYPQFLHPRCDGKSLLCALLAVQLAREPKCKMRVVLQTKA